MLVVSTGVTWVRMHEEWKEEVPVCFTFAFLYYTYKPYIAIQIYCPVETGKSTLTERHSTPQTTIWSQKRPSNLFLLSFDNLSKNTTLWASLKLAFVEAVPENYVQKPPQRSNLTPWSPNGMSINYKTIYLIFFFHYCIFFLWRTWMGDSRNDLNQHLQKIISRSQ